MSEYYYTDKAGVRRELLGNLSPDQRRALLRHLLEGEGLPSVEKLRELWNIVDDDQASGDWWMLRMCFREKSALKDEVRTLRRQVSHLKELAQRDPVALMVAVQGLEVSE